MSYNLHYLILLSLLIQHLNSFGQESLHKNDHLDESIEHGILPNGLSYYIKNIPESEEKINLRFYVKAGINHQDSDQQNMAHFVEHMAFKPSEHFPRGIFNEHEIWNSLEMSAFDLNGTAGKEFTQYSYKAPQDNIKAIETALNWFYDIANGLHFKDEEIETERGILIQEYLMRSGNSIKSLAKKKLEANFFPCYSISPDFIEHQKNVKPERLKQFYNDWYRPELMTVVAVGKIENIQELKEMIIQHFEGLTSGGPKREFRNCNEEYFNQPPQFKFIEFEQNQKDEKGVVETHLYYRLPNFGFDSEMSNPLNFDLKIDLLLEIVNNRFREAARVYNNSYESFIRREHYPPSIVVTIISKNDHEQNGLRNTVKMLNQIQAQGVLPIEFKDALKKQLNKLNRIAFDKPQFWLEGIEKHMIHGVSHFRNEVDSLRSWLEAYNLEDFQHFVTSNKGFDFPQDIGIVSLANSRVLLVNETEIRSSIENLMNEPVSEYLPPKPPKSLMTTSEIENLSVENIIGTRLTDSGAREIVLSNGVKILMKSFKPTSQHDQVLALHGFNKSGALSFSKEDYFSAIYAPEFVKNGGIAQMDKFQLQKYLKDTSLNLMLLDLYIHNYESGIRMNGKSEDLEKMLQLIYLYFTNPRIDMEAFEDWKSMKKASTRNSFINYKQINLQDQIDKILGNHSRPPRGTESFKGIDKANLSRGADIFKKLFGDSDEWTFILTGDFSEDLAIPLLSKYLGNLPNISNREPKVVPPYHSRPVGPAIIEFRTQDTVSNQNLYYRPYYFISSPPIKDFETIIEADALGRIFDLKLWELRFQKSFSLYSITAAMVFNEEIQQFGYKAVIDCNPEEFPEIRSEFFKIIEDLKSGNISPEIIDQGFKEIEQKYISTYRNKSNKDIQKSLYDQIRFETTWPDENEVLSHIKSLSREKIAKLANKYFTEEFLLEFILSSRHNPDTKL